MTMRTRNTNHLRVVPPDALHPDDKPSPELAALRREIKRAEMAQGVDLSRGVRVDGGAASTASTEAVALHGQSSAQRHRLPSKKKPAPWDVCKRCGAWRLFCRCGFVSSSTPESAAPRLTHPASTSTTGSGLRSVVSSERAYTTPCRTAADHEDDELMHGRVGASLRDRRPMSTRAWVALLLAFWVALIVADLAGRAS